MIQLMEWLKKDPIRLAMTRAAIMASGFTALWAWDYRYALFAGGFFGLIKTVEYLEKKQNRFRDHLMSQLNYGLAKFCDLGFTVIPIGSPSDYFYDTKVDYRLYLRDKENDKVTPVHQDESEPRFIGVVSHPDLGSHYFLVKKDGDKYYFYPAKLRDGEEVAEKLAGILGMEVSLTTAPHYNFEVDGEKKAIYAKQGGVKNRSVLVVDEDNRLPSLEPLPSQELESNIVEYPTDKSSNNLA